VGEVADCLSSEIVVSGYYLFGAGSVDNFMVVCNPVMCELIQMVPSNLIMACVTWQLIGLGVCITPKKYEDTHEPSTCCGFCLAPCNVAS
jgi:hypothetical protein